MPRNPNRIRRGFDEKGVLIAIGKDGVPLRRNPSPREIKKFFDFRAKLSPLRRSAKFPFRRVK